LPLDDKRGLKLTTALYYTPTGRSIQAEGIVPDIIIEDIKIPVEDEDKKTPWFKLKESDLTGHLANGNGGAHKSAKKTKSGVEFKTPSPEKDYQLYEAYNLLRSIAIYEKRIKRSI